MAIVGDPITGARTEFATLREAHEVARTRSLGNGPQIIRDDDGEVLDVYVSGERHSVWPMLAGHNAWRVTVSGPLCYRHLGWVESTGERSFQWETASGGWGQLRRFYDAVYRVVQDAAREANLGCDC
jgi:hypothetical protein